MTKKLFLKQKKRLDLINSLKAKYGQTIHEILSYQKEQQEKLEKLQRFEENFRLLKEKLMQAEKILEELRMNFQRSGKNTVNSWMKRLSKD